LSLKKRPPCGPRGERPKQHLPVDIVTDLLTAIRNQFYADSRDQFLKDQHFIKREFCLYLASWLDKRGVTLKPDRYKALLLGLLNEIKTHGNTAAVKYWPGYLKHVLQQHLKHHGEDIYQEAKSLRTLAENSLLSLSHLNGGANAAAEPTLDPVRALAEARRDLLTLKRQKKLKTSGQDGQSQLDLF
jgi:hypothetical protein